MFANKLQFRSPIKARSLRTPGQSLDEARLELVERTFETPGMIAAFMSVLAVLEWYRHLMAMQPSPVIFTIAAAVSIAFALYRFFQMRREVRNLRLAMEGERAVGQFLESLREKGYQVFHDLLGVGFNVDHVLIGPAGVFTIETKTWRKPTNENKHIKFDGESISVGSFQPDRDPIVQGHAQAGWLRELLKESTGKTFHVWPVIVFPGWFVDPPSNKKPRIWVLEPKALPAFLANEPVRMAPEDVKLASFHLSRFIRSSEENRRPAPQ